MSDTPTTPKADPEPQNSGGNTPGSPPPPPPPSGK